jgi:hypothetical protein
MTAPDPRADWDAVPFEEHEARHWRLGGLDLFAQRADDAWYLQSTVVAIDPDAPPEPIVGERIDWRPENSAADVVRHLQVVDEGPPRLALRPRLPDRAVVAAPREPVALLPEQRTVLWVGVAAWLAVCADGVEAPLVELPTLPLRQTWFGPDTRSGTLCYAGRTRCRTRLEDLAPHPFRIIVPVRLRNRAADPWRLERVALPVELLSVLRRPDGALMTPGLAITRDPDGDVEEVHVDAGIPGGLEAAPIAPPRREAATSLLGRFYGALF